jgi:hypothetical protein
MPPPSSSSSRLPVCTKGWDSRPSEPASLRHVRMRAIRFLGNAYTRLLATRCHPTTSSLTMISFRTSTSCSATSTWETTPPLFPLLQPRRMCYVLSLSLSDHPRVSRSSVPSRCDRSRYNRFIYSVHLHD